MPRICDVYKPLQSKWIRVRSQWSFAWLSSEGNISVNEALTENLQHTTQHCAISSQKTTKCSLCLYPEATAVYFGSLLYCRCPFQQFSTTLTLLECPLKSTSNIKWVIKYRNETAGLLLCLTALCLGMTVTLRCVADAQTQQEWCSGGKWWSGSGHLQRPSPPVFLKPCRATDESI